MLLQNSIEVKDIIPQPLMDGVQLAHFVSYNRTINMREENCVPRSKLYSLLMECDVYSLHNTLGHASSFA